MQAGFLCVRICFYVCVFARICSCVCACLCTYASMYDCMCALTYMYLWIRHRDVKTHVCIALPLMNKPSRLSCAYDKLIMNNMVISVVSGTFAYCDIIQLMADSLTN